MSKEFTGARYHKDWETLLYSIKMHGSTIKNPPFCTSPHLTQHDDRQTVWCPAWLSLCTIFLPHITTVYTAAMGPLSAYPTLTLVLGITWPWLAADPTSTRLHFLIKMLSQTTVCPINISSYVARIIWVNYLSAGGGAVGWGTALHVERSRVRFPKVSVEFFTDIFPPAALWSWGWLSL
jgi:hypothetical protein